MTQSLDAVARAHVERRQRLLDRLRRLLIEKLRVPREPDEIDPDVPLFVGGLGRVDVDNGGPFAFQRKACFQHQLGYDIDRRLIGTRKTSAKALGDE